MATGAPPRISARQVLRALIMGMLIAGVSGLVHDAHGHAPSLPLVIVTSVLVVIACLPLSARTLRWRGALGTMLAGELLLHAWFAWFSMPEAGVPSTTTALLHHGGTITATLAPRDFASLVPSPTMMVGHLAAALVLAWALASADRCERFAAHLLRFLAVRAITPTALAPRSRPPLPRTRISVSVGDVIAQSVRRRGPPALGAV